MNHQEWLEWRFNGIGASDAAVVMKLFPYGITPVMLWEEKVNRILREETDAMRHGKEREPQALAWFEKKKGVALLGQIALNDKEYPWMLATLDGVDADGKYLVEIKCPYNIENHYKVKETRKVPAIYYPQCQQQMRVRQVDGMYFLSYNWQNPDDSVILEIEKNNSYVDQLVNEGGKFWQCVKDKVAPPLTDLDYVSMEGNENWKVVADEYKQIDHFLDHYEKRKEELKIQLRSLAKERSARGAGIELQKQPRKGVVDYSLIPQLKGVDTSPYRKEGCVAWPVRVMKRGVST